MRAVYSFESSGVGASSGGGLPAAATARQLAESLSTLPLPEDYALQVTSTWYLTYLMHVSFHFKIFVKFYYKRTIDYL